MADEKGVKPVTPDERWRVLMYACWMNSIGNIFLACWIGVIVNG